MATAALPKMELPTDWSLADLRRHLGGIPLRRIRLFPPPGMATMLDVVELHDRENRLFELVDGILVEKPMGFYEALLAGIVLTKLSVYLESKKLGKALGADGMMKVLSTQIRIPDAAFVSWDRLPKGKRRRTPVPAVVPDLAVEVLSASNTTKEMQRKLEEYFEAGVRMVWYIDPQRRIASIYTAVDRVRVIKKSGAIDGGRLLPSFKLSLRDLFASADEEGPGPA